MRNFLHWTAAIITWHSRDQVNPGKDFEWNNLVVYNAWRVFEMVFGRRSGIKAEGFAHFTPGTATYYYQSWEAIFTQSELFIRGLIPRRWPVKVWIPLLQPVQGSRKFSSPYLFAIAFDNVASEINTATTWSYTVTGANPYINVGVVGEISAADNMTGLTYNGVSMLPAALKLRYPADRWAYFCNLKAPATGAHNIVETGITGYQEMYAFSYSGVDQTTPIDSSHTNDQTATPTTTMNFITTVVAANCWMTGFSYGSGGWTNGTMTLRGTQPSSSAMVDTNGTVATGSQTKTLTISNGAYLTHTFSIAPAAGGGGSTPQFVIPPPFIGN